jgi:signal transduction histidine kinase
MLARPLPFPVSTETRVIAAMVAWIALIHFVVEAFIMGTLAGWQLDHGVIAEGLLDCVLLTLLSSPPIYYFVAKPFIEAAQSARAELAQELDLRTQQTDNLERTRVSLESSLGQNEQLRKRLQQSNGRVAEINELTLQRIGADLHDGPAQLLTYSLLRLGKMAPILKQGGNVRDLELLEGMQHALSDSLNELRNISRGLSLPQLSEAGLEAVIGMAVTLHQELTGTKVQLTMSNLPASVPDAIKICVYRVVQESLSNAFKHGGAAEQRVEVFMENMLTLKVSDQGPGMAAKPPGRGLGLSGMRARVEALGGTLSIDSGQGKGTTVTARLDVNEIASRGNGNG